MSFNEYEKMKKKFAILKYQILNNLKYNIA